VRNVKGVLFLDYVRMVKANRAAEWAAMLEPRDMAFLSEQIDPSGWYPMETFERFGVAILKFVARDQLFPVQLWGRYSATQLHAANPALLAVNDPLESISRFRVLRQTFFDFEALEVPLIHPGAAQIRIRYHMGAVAEEAACYQTMGFFEGLIELAGASRVDARFRQRSWDGDPQTRLDLMWSMPEDR
jgi:hypothetical protein